MTTLLLFLAIIGLWTVQTAVIMWHIKAKVDPIYKQLDTLVKFMQSADS